MIELATSWWAVWVLATVLTISEIMKRLEAKLKARVAEREREWNRMWELDNLMHEIRRAFPDPYRNNHSARDLRAVWAWIARQAEMRAKEDMMKAAKKRQWSYEKSRWI